MALSGEPYSKITKMVGMHKSCITIWKQKVLAKSLDGIKLGYKGSFAQSANVLSGHIIGVISLLFIPGFINDQLECLPF